MSDNEYRDLYGNRDENTEGRAEDSTEMRSEEPERVNTVPASEGENAFVLVETPVQEQTSSQTSAQGAFSGAGFSGQTFSEQFSSEPSSSRQPFSARDIQPRKKTGFGRRVASLLLSGVILGTSAAGAYIGVTYAVHKSGVFADAEAEQPVEAVVKEPEIQKVEDNMALQAVSSEAVGTALDVSAVVDTVMPAMVSIVNNYTETINSFFGQTYTREGASSGSGIIIGENESELLIATNNHVVSDSNAIEITFIDGTTAQAYLKGAQADMDLAVVSVALDSLTAETKSAIAIASLGDSDSLKLGEPVIAIGNALGYGQSVTTGVVSAVNRQINTEEGVGTFIQTDAAINPGNSGGALLNLQGQVIGINSNKIGGSTIEGMGYAIPINAAQPIISDLSLKSTKMKVEESKRGYIAISLQEVTESISQMFGMPQGVFVAEIQAGSPAAASDMQVKDIIVKFDDMDITSNADLQNAMQYYEAGTTVTIEVMRQQNDGLYASVTFELTLGAKTQ